MSEKLTFDSMEEANKYLATTPYGIGHARFDCNICGEYISNCKCMSWCGHPWILIPCDECKEKINNTVEKMTIAKNVFAKLIKGI